MNTSAICIISLVGLTLSYGTTATAQQRDEFDHDLVAMVEELISQDDAPQAVYPPRPPSSSFFLHGRSARQGEKALRYRSNFR